MVHQLQSVALFAILLLVLCSPRGARANVAYYPKKEESQKVKTSKGDALVWIAFDDSCECVDTIIFVGVGTAMTVTAYSSLASDVVTNSKTAMVMADHKPNDLFKQDWYDWQSESRDKFAALANHTKENMAEYVHRMCQTSQFVVGGHSSSGLTAIQAIHYGLIPADGYLGIDPILERIPSFLWPFPGAGAVYDAFELKIPVMIWGFSKDTCKVIQSKGSQLVYNKSDSSMRVLYQIQTNATDTGHCDFTDKGCPSVCTLSSNNETVWVERTLVAEAIRKVALVVADPSHYFNRTFLELSQSSLVTIVSYVNEDVIHQLTVGRTAGQSVQCAN